MSLTRARGSRYGNEPVRHSSMGEIMTLYHACMSAREARAGSTIFRKDITLIALCSDDRLFEIRTQEKTLDSVLVDKTRPKQFPAKNRAPALEE